jgi:cytochrome c biogenesis protein CcdA
MVALINPCGFALLPAYLGFFLGLDEDDAGETRLRALNRAQIVGLSLSLGFLAVFGVLGLAFAGAIGSISSILRYVTLVMGVGLVVLGVAMLRGFQPLVKIPKLEKGTGSRSAASMFLFGVSYAVASLSCTIGLFLSALPSENSGASFIDRFGAFLSYGIGMGLLATVLTLAVAFGKKGIVNNMRSILPKINLISAIVLVVVGTYVALYGIWSIQIFDPDIEDPTPWIDSIVTTAESWQASLSNFVGDQASWFGPLFVVVNVGLALAGYASRRTDQKTAVPV